MMFCSNEFDNTCNMSVMLPVSAHKLVLHICEFDRAPSLSLNLSSSTHNCGCMVDAGNTMAAI